MFVKFKDEYGDTIFINPLLVQSVTRGRLPEDESYIAMIGRDECFLVYGSVFEVVKKLNEGFEIHRSNELRT